MMKYTIAAFAFALVFGITAPAFADRDDYQEPTQTHDGSSVESSENHAVVLQEHA